MKTAKIISLALCIFSLGALSAQEQPVKILAIGNSFSDDGIEYLDEVAISAGKHIIVANTYIGGCSLAQHLDNARNDKHNYKYRKNTEGQYSETPGTSLDEALADEDWDYIVFHQVSAQSGQYSAFFPELSELIEYVKGKATNPNVRFALQQTWAYASDSNHPNFYRYGKDQNAMYEDIIFTYTHVARRQGIDIVIPSGTTIQNARSSSLGDTLCRDGYHLGWQYGRYAAACAWFETFFGEPATTITYKPEGVTDQQANIARNAAHFAVLNPLSVTDMSNF